MIFNSDKRHARESGFFQAIRSLYRDGKIYSRSSANMNVALVGAGSAGLATLRLKVVCYEKIDQVDAHGSTEKKLDQDCLTIHTSMYKNFR